MILLDTCTLLWLVVDQQKLSTRAQNSIQQHANDLYVSAISAFEIGTKYQKGLLELPFAPLEWFQKALDWHGITELPITSKIATNSALLPAIHKDPADRIIIATALENNMLLLTPDTHIQTYCNHTRLTTLF